MENAVPCLGWELPHSKGVGVLRVYNKGHVTLGSFPPVLGEPWRSQGKADVLAKIIWQQGRYDKGLTSRLFIDPEMRVSIRGGKSRTHQYYAQSMYCMCLQVFRAKTELDNFGKARCIFLAERRAERAHWWPMIHESLQHRSAMPLSRTPC